MVTHYNILSTLSTRKTLSKKKEFFLKIGLTISLGFNIISLVLVKGTTYGGIAQLARAYGSYP
jgi:hypothetical protein